MAFSVVKIAKTLRIVALSAVGVGLSVSGHCQLSLTNGLIAFYPFNGNADDASGNGHNGIVDGAVLVRIPAAVGH